MIVDSVDSGPRTASASGSPINSRLKIAAFGLRPAGFVARSLQSTTGWLVARASPAGLGPAAKCNLYLLTGPKDGSYGR